VKTTNREAHFIYLHLALLYTAYVCTMFSNILGVLCLGRDWPSFTPI